MATAILMSGQLRSFSQTYPGQKWFVYRHYEDCHFFIVVQNNDQVNSIQALRRDYGADRVHAQFITDPTGLPQIPEEAGRHAPYQNAAPHAQLMMQHWYQLQVWEYFQQAREGKEFDTIIRMRPDNWMQEFEPPSRLSRPHDIVHVPWFGSFGGINDRMAIMGNIAAKTYFTLYNRVERLLKAGCPFHPESLLKATLEFDGIRIQKMNAIFGTLRLPRPDPKDPNRMIQEMRFPEIQQHEIAQYAKT